MKKLLLMLAVLFTAGVVSAQSKTPDKKANTQRTEKNAHAAGVSDHREADTKANKTNKHNANAESTEPQTTDAPAAPGTQSGATTPLDAPSNKSNASPENNGSAPRK